MLVTPYALLISDGVRAASCSVPNSRARSARACRVDRRPAGTTNAAARTAGSYATVIIATWAPNDWPTQ